jgi:hypothetical protein
MLAIGDHVVWTRAREPVAGRIVARAPFNVKIEWVDGTTSEMFFNDMMHVERPRVHPRCGKTWFHLGTPYFPGLHAPCG